VLCELRLGWVHTPFRPEHLPLYRGREHAPGRHLLKIGMRQLWTEGEGRGLRGEQSSMPIVRIWFTGPIHLHWLTSVRSFGVARP
jgi:hypothetical protein